MLKEKAYSIDLSKMHPDAEPHEISVVSGNYIQQEVREYRNSLNFGKALGNYLIEKNRTKDLAKQYAYERQKLNVRNEEFRKQQEIRINNYVERINSMVEKERQQLVLETERIQIQGQEYIDIVKCNRLAEQERREIFNKVISLHYQYIIGMQTILREIEKDKIQFILQNRYYYELQECVISNLDIIARKMKQIVE